MPAQNGSPPPSTTPRSVGLFERWLALERKSGRSLSDILSELNHVCGTRYRHNWPSMMARREYSLDRCPTDVRRYMMRVVLADELARYAIMHTPARLERMIRRLT